MRTLSSLLLVSVLFSQEALAGELPARPMPLTATESRAVVASLPEKVAVAAPRVKFTLSSSIVSKYVSPHGYQLTDEPVLQSDLKVSWANGFSVGVMWSVGTDDTEISSNPADEIDLYAGWTKKLGDFSLNVGVANFNFVELDSLDKDLLVAYAEVGRPFKVGDGHALTPFVRMEGRWRLPDLDWPRSMPVVGVKHSWDVAPGLTLSQRIGFLHDGGVPISDSGWLLQYRLGMTYKVSDSVNLEPYVRLSLPLTINDQRENQTLVGISLTINL